MGRDHARTGTIVQTDAGDLASCNVVARLLAVAPPPRFNGVGPSAGDLPRGSGYRGLASRAREAAVVCFGGSVRGDNNPRAISWRRCAYIPRLSYCAAAGERAGVVCEGFNVYVLGRWFG